MKQVITAFGLFSLAVMNSAFANCPITKAIYAYDKNPSVTARFHPLQRKSLTNVYFTVISSTGQVLWFTFDWGNGFTTERLVSSKTNPGSTDWQPQDPDSKKDRLFADLDFYAFNKDMTVSSGKIKDGEFAPEYLFVPQLAPTLWYSRHKNVFSDTLERAMFKLSQCDEQTE